MTRKTYKRKTYKKILTKKKLTKKKNGGIFSRLGSKMTQKLEQNASNKLERSLENELHTEINKVIDSFREFKSNPSKKFEEMFKDSYVDDEKVNKMQHKISHALENTTISDNPNIQHPDRPFPSFPTPIYNNSSLQKNPFFTLSKKPLPNIFPTPYVSQYVHSPFQTSILPNTGNLSLSYEKKKFDPKKPIHFPISYSVKK